MSVEDDIKRMREQLRSKGINVGGWTDVEEKEVKSPILERQKEALGKVAVLLEQQVERDHAEMAQLHIALQRLKNGGGA